MKKEISMLTEAEREALEVLIEIAKGSSGQSKRVADFLLAWWNAEQCGGFDLTDTWAVDGYIARAMCVIFLFVSGVREYPDGLGYRDDFVFISKRWRPNLWS